VIFTIWESVRISNRPLDILLFDSFHVLAWCGHFQLDVGFVILVYVIYDIFYLRKFLLGVLICKITPHRDQNILPQSVVSIILNKVYELHHFFVGVKGRE